MSRKWENNSQTGKKISAKDKSDEGLLKLFKEFLRLNDKKMNLPIQKEAESPYKHLIKDIHMVNKQKKCTLLVITN